MGSEETKDRILQAAIEVFARDGFAGAHVAEIAERAEANVALIYRYFGNKEGLLDAVLERFVQVGRLHRHEAFAGQPLPTTPEQIDALVRCGWDYLEERRDLIKIVLFESLKNKDPEAVLIQLFDASVLSRLPSELTRRRDDEALQLVAAAFFFGMMPFLSCLVFYQPWAAHAGVDPERVKEAFFTVFEELYAKHIIDELERIGEAGQGEEV